MAYTQTPPVSPSMAGTAVVYAAVPAGGLAVLPGSILLVKNASGGSINVTLNVQKTYKGYTLTSPVVAVGAATELAIGPIPAEVHVVQNSANANNGYILVDFSAVASVTAAVLSVPQ